MIEDWIECELGEVFNVVSGNTPAELKVANKDGDIPFFKVSDMNHGGNEVFMKHSNIFLSNDEVESLKIKLYPKETVIFPKRGGAILTNKKRILINEAGFDLNVMGILPTNFVIGFYTYYWFIKLDLGKIYDGSNVPQINNKNILPLRFPLAPLPIQRAIVSKIEALFSDLDNGIANFKKVQEQLKIYRQAVLKKAFEGELTKEWREKYPSVQSTNEILNKLTKERIEIQGKIRKSKDSNLQGGDELDLPKLPSTWEWVKPDQICSPEPYSIGIGPFGSNLKVSDYTDFGVPLIFVKNITRQNFDLVPKFISKKKFEELIPHSVKPLDILITKMGDPPGDCTIYPESKEVAVLTSDCLKFRVWDKYVSRKFILYCIETQFVKKQLGLITSGVAQKKISTERFKTVSLAFTNLEEQEAIVTAIESRLSVADQLEKSIRQSLDKAEALRQSILKKAFEGKLLSQAEIELCKKEADYEPASELLKKIQAEKLAKEQEKKKPILKKKGKK